MIHRDDIGRFARFALVGGLSTGIYFGLLLLLRDVIASTLVLAGVCYALSMALNYVAQSTFTFRAGRPSRRAARRFVVMHAGALAFNAGAMGALVDLAGAMLLPSQVLVTGVLAVSTYLASKHWVYA